jgi:hypothetical protein
VTDERSEDDRMTSSGVGVGCDLPGSVRCPECDVTGKQRLNHHGEGTYHLRCQSCGVTCAYAGDPPDGELLDYAAAVERTRIKPRPYRPTSSFGPGELIDHVKFGLGYVLVMREPPDKMEVLFADQQRLLVCQPKASGKSKAEPGKLKRGKPAATNRTTGTVHRAAVGAPPEPELKQCPGCGKLVHPQNFRYAPNGKAVSCIFCK